MTEVDLAGEQVTFNKGSLRRSRETSSTPVGAVRAFGTPGISSLVTTESRIFLAHAREDKSRIRQLYHDLKTRGFEPWLDEMDLRAGQIWKNEISKVIREARLFLACLVVPLAKPAMSRTSSEKHWQHSQSGRPERFS